MNRKRIKCRKCKGKGIVNLDPILAGTLHILTEMKSASAPQMFEALAPDYRGTVTALNKRLERLRVAGLVVRKSKNGGWVYSPKKGK